ncbi:glycosyltransferase [Halanaerobacter jeridensis]|uniref:Glycosyltransferase involved in cell wall biosynthesis n=1 Tax=Halanaerobacter jeridensis TaxID=706427 RepID=A0A939BPE1_9FIRM|nr:glycosyltransferase [Halanaerobacter jeridensis]MBM7556927.1 glycosyltransferase involved in cell wall biosynthesis [Halanaerobacter jeridensis]
MNYKPKVLIIPSWYPDNQNPIQGIFFKKQAEALNEFLNIAVLNIDMSVKKYLKNNYFLNRNNFYKENNVLTLKNNRFNFGRLINSFNTKLYQKHFDNGFEKIVDQFGKPDLIHAHVSYPAGYGAMFLSQKYDIPFLVSEHASFFESKLIKNYKKNIDKILEKADLYTAVSTFLQKKILKYGRKQCKVIPNFIDCSKFNSEVDKENSDFENTDKFNLLNVSQMRDIKGIDYLISALNKLVFDYNFKNIHLHLVGDGEKIDKYKKMTKKLDINSYCTFYGQISNEKVAEYMTLSDALVISSKIETFGVVGIEAMAAGLPILATKCGGPEDYVEEINGLLVEKESVSSLVEGIKNLINSYSKFNSVEIKKYTNDNYGKESVSKDLIRLYMDLIN